MSLTDTEVVEHFLLISAEWLKLIVEGLGVFVIGLGVLIGGFQTVQTVVIKRSADFTYARFTFARYLALALEFQLAADILGTAISPDWNQIGQLAAIAAIRTALNFFLMHEMAEQQELLEKALPEKEDIPVKKSH